MAEPRLRLRSVHLHSPEGAHVFRDQDFDLAPGARIRLVPEAGCGCSAFLRLAAGLTHPLEGEVLVDGSPYQAFGGLHPTQRQGRLGWVPTEGGLIVNLSILANLTLPLRYVRGLGAEEAREVGLAWLARLDLAPRADKRPHAFDASDRWLLTLARGVAMGADLWLVDRPPSILDEQSAGLARTLLEEGLGKDEAAALVVDPEDGWAGPPFHAFVFESGRWVPGGDA